MSLENYLGKILNLKNMVSYFDGSVVSKEILRKSTGTLTIFAFDKGQGLSEHTAPFDATVLIVEGKANIFINSVLHQVNEGEMIIMPANVPHSLYAEEPFKMLLIMIKS